MRWILGLMVLGGLAAIGFAEPVTMTPAVVLAQPGATGGALRGVGAPALTRVDCTAPPCAPGDAACRARALAMVAACAQGPGATLDGVRAEQPVALETTVFRASGGGLVLYGTVGGPVGPEVLAALADAGR